MPLLRASCCNFGSSSSQTHIISFLVSFLHFLTFFIDFPLIFRYHNQRMERINWIPRLKTLCWFFWGKTSLTKSNVPEARFRFLPFSKHLPTTEENQNWFIGSRTISCNWGETFRLSHKERLLEPISKSPYIVNYLWDGVSNYVCSIILVIAKIYIYSSLFHFSFVIEAKPTFLDCVSSNICSCFLSLFKLHETFWFMN